MPAQSSSAAAHLWLSTLNEQHCCSFAHDVKVEIAAQPNGQVLVASRFYMESPAVSGTFYQSNVCPVERLAKREPVTPVRQASTKDHRTSITAVLTLSPGLDGQ